MAFHQRRMALTAKAAVSGSVPTLTQPVLLLMSYTPYGTARFSLGSMQPGMDPCAFGTRIILGDVVSGLPIPAQSVPHGPEQWDGRRRRGTGLQTVKKGSDLCIHE